MIHRHDEKMSKMKGQEMERNKNYQLDNSIFEIVVWLLVMAIVCMDIKVTFF
jgi:hypothetical protein